MTAAVTATPDGRTTLASRAQATPAPIAIVCNTLPPYRVHVHQRIVRELPEVELWTLCTHESTGDRWRFAPPPEIRPVSFGVGETVHRQDQLRYVFSEWLKGGRIIKWMKEHRIRAVVMLGYNDAARMRIIRWCGKNSIPCFLWGDSNIRGDKVRGWKALFKKWMMRRIIRNCAGLFPCGEMGKQYFARYGGDENRMFYYPVEPDYDLIANLPQQRIDEVGAQYKLSPNRRRLIFSGRLVPAKRADLVVNAFLAIAPQRPEWDLVMAGDGPMREQLMKLIPPELSARVLWTGFIDDQPAVSALYRLSDVLVLPSDFEPWALVVNEAAAAGLAMVCSDAVGAAAELVRSDVNGYTFPAGDLNALVGAMLNVTAPEKIDVLKAASPPIAQHWRSVADPIAGLRRALQANNVIA